MKSLKHRSLVLFTSIFLLALGMVGVASTWQGSLSDPLAQTVSAQTVERGGGQKNDILAVPATIAPALEESDEAVAASKKDTGGFSADYKTQKNDLAPELAPLTGTLNIPGDYATLALAITDLNTQGVGIGGVTFNVVAGNPQTAPGGGYIIGGTGSAVLTTASAANPITFTGNGNTITAPTPQTSGALNDAIIKLIGADFVTIQNFTLQENAANTTTASGTNNMTEWGIALLYVTTTDGSQNNTIKNNTISLNRTYQNSFGIYSNVNHTATAVTTTATITSPTGSNSGNKVYGNAISNVNYGTIFIGSSALTAVGAQDNGNDIGGSSLATGNTYTNWGGIGVAPSGYATLTGNNYCIFVNNQYNDNISFNSITSAASTSGITMGGILKNYSTGATAQPTGTITTTINNNTVQITNNPSAATVGSIIGINNQGLSPLLSTATMNMNNNTVQNSFVGGAIATTASFTAMTNLSLPGTMNMTGNTVINSGLSSTAATSPSLVGISNTGAAGTVNLNNNILRSLSSTAASGQLQGIANSGAVTTAINIKDNQFGNASSGYFTSTVASSGALFGSVNAGGNAAALLTMTGNDIRGISYTNATATASQNYYNNQVFTGSVNISSNTITNVTASTTTGGVTMIGNSVTRAAGTTATVNNNSIVTAFNKTGVGGTVAFYNSFGSSPSSVTEINTGNNFSNVTMTGATAFIGWRSADGTTPGPKKTVTNNTFSNITGGTSALTSVLYVGFSDNTSNTTNVSGNVISGVSAAASISVIFSDGQNQNFFDNRINTISSTGAAASVKAFEFTGATTQNVFRNKIYDIQATDAAGTVNGIFISSGTTFNVYNNLIGDLRTPAGNAANPINGINLTSATAPSNINVSFNTIFLNATSSGTNFGSSGIFHTTSATATTAALTLRNNIIVNNSTPNGTGLSAAYRRSSATLTNYTSTSNNNDFFGSTIYTDGTNTFAAITPYKAFVAARDGASFAENPTFLSTSGPSANFLHMDPTVATQIESGGATVSGITDDYDVQTRNVSTPDIGADEFSGIPIDLSAPNITYSAFANTGLVTNRVLATTITDASGVAAGANLPRIYFKKSTDGAYVSTQCVMTGGTALNGTYDCTINYALVGGASVTVADVVQYFVVAQDISGNLGSNPGGATGANVNTVAFGGVPNSYTILPAISGPKNVGSGGDYPTITAAVAAINGAEITGPVTLTLTDATYPTETFPLTINANSGSSSTNTVVMQPAPGVSPNISGSSATCLVNLNGADWITIDGSNGGGTPAGTSRDMTLANTNAGVSSAVVCMTSTGTGAGATNDTVKNTNIVGSGNAQTLFGVYSGGASISITGAGADNDSDRVENNNISATQYGVYSGGISTGNKNGGTVITRNLMNAIAPNNIAKGGVLARFEDGIQITENSIGNMAFSVSFSTTTFGIALGVIPNNTFTGHTGSDVTNAQLVRNSIVNVAQTATGSAYGIIINSVTSGTTLVKNNMVSGVTSNTTPSDITCGILAGGGTGSTTQIYNNSVYLLGDRGAGTTSGSFAFAYGGGDPVMDIKNNVFANTQTTTSTGLSYAIGTNSSTFVNLTSTNNDLFTTTGAAFAVGRTGGIDQGAGSPTGVDKVTLAAWNATTGQDSTLLSKSVDPLFVSGSDLHLQESPSQSPVVLSGVSIGSVTNDFDNDPRPTASNPDMGADEVVQTDGGTFPAGTFYNARPTVGSTFAGNFTVTGTLYPAGIVDIGANTVTLGCNAATGGVDLNNYIVGNVQKDFCAAGSFNYPVGTVPNGSARGDQTPEGSPSEYTPVLVTVNSGSFPASLAISVTDTFLPGLGATSSLSRNWTVTQTGGALNVDMQFQYLNEDVYGVETSYKPFKYNGVTTVQQPGSINAAGNQFTATGVTSFSKWGAGVAAPTAANADISGRVTTAGGMPIANVKVTLTGGGLDHTVVGYTSSLGYYNFEGLPVGQNYVVTVKSRRFFFSEPSHFITLQDNITDGDFVADPQQ